MRLIHTSSKIPSICICLVVVLVNSCSPPLEIDLPPADSLNSIYPIGIHKAEGTNAESLIISRYAADKPVLVYLPDRQGPFPLVMFQHGRPFTMPSDYGYSPSRELVNATVDQGFALAVVIRSGYFSARGADKEIIPCNRPQFEDVRIAGEYAGKNVVDAVSYLKSLQIVEDSKIVLAGTSAGGFAAVNSMPDLDEEIVAVISINGGRCGGRGDAVGGLSWQQELYSRIAADTQAPVYFLAGSDDDVIPVYSTRTLFMAFCRARNDCVERSRTQLFVGNKATHDVATMTSEYSRALRLIAGSWTNSTIPAVAHE